MNYLHNNNDFKTQIVLFISYLKAIGSILTNGIFKGTGNILQTFCHFNKEDAFFVTFLLFSNTQFLLKRFHSKRQKLLPYHFDLD